MPKLKKSIDVNVPVRVAYDQWTQFEDFPEFMEGVKRVEQLDDKRLRWTANVAGKEKSWEAEIVDQTPDRRVAWKSVDGAENAGAVMFEPIGSDRTRITLTLDAEPEGPVETAGDALGFLRRPARLLAAGHLGLHRAGHHAQHGERKPLAREKDQPEADSDGGLDRL